MAQDFPGANNIALLSSSGFFGSRRQLGKDHGAARYVSAKLSDITRLIYPEEDDKLLQIRIEDNEEVEPIYYVPIIPMVLIMTLTSPCATPLQDVSTTRVRCQVMK
jgi:DNA topoisomerase-2